MILPTTEEVHRMFEEERQKELACRDPFQDANGVEMRVGQTLESLLNPGYRMVIRHIDIERRMVLVGFPDREGVVGLIKGAGDWKVVEP